MLTKLFGFLIIFIALLLPTQAFAIDSASLSLSPATNTYNKSCNFSLDINLNTDNSDTDGTDVVLRYDPAVLSATSITQGTTYPDYPSKSIDSTGGVINISGLASVDKPFNGSGVFATVNFLVNSNASTGLTQIKFDFDANNTADTKDSNVVKSGQVVDILKSVTNGTYTIGTGNCAGSGGTVNTPTPAPGTFGTPVVGSGYPPGTIMGPNGVIYYPQGATGSGYTPPSTLPRAGVSTPTLILAITGSILVIAGILGLALL